MKKRGYKRIVLVNPDRAFNDFSKISSEMGVNNDVIESAECALILFDHENHYVLNKNNEVLTSDTYFLIRSRGKKISDHYFLSLLSEYFYRINAPFTSQINRAHSLSAGKITQMVKFIFAGVDIPYSVICRRQGFEANKEAILKKISFPCVLKIDGANGRNVWKIDGKIELENKIKELDSDPGSKKLKVFLIQEYIQNTFDLRVIVFQNSVLGAMKRISSDGFHNNISRGGSAEVVTLTAEEEEIAARACKAVHVDFGGVDIVRSKRGPLVLEVNRKPGILGKSGFVTTTGINVVQEIISILTNKDR